MDDKHDLILSLHSQIFEYLREIISRRALGYLEPAPYKNGKKNFLRKRPTIIGLLKAVVGVGTFSPLAPVLGPEQIKWLWHPLPLLMAVSTLFGVFSLNQPVYTPVYTPGCSVCEADAVVVIFLGHRFSLKSHAG